MAVKKKGLGSKGLGIEALINSKIDDYNEMERKDGVMELGIDMIEPNRQQPRKYFAEEALEELAQSLKTYGMIQPIIVKKNGEYYEIIAGERRWRAAKIAGLKTLPAIEKDWESGIAFEAALVENIQREDLNAIEEAESYQRLQEEFSLNQEAIAKKVGKSRSAVANSMRLLQLDKRVRGYVVENRITAGHARALLAIANGDDQFELAEDVIEDELSVRATENLVKAYQNAAEKEERKKIAEKNEDETQNEVLYTQLEDTMKDIFSTKVKIKQKKNKGKIEIEYYSSEDLDRLLGIMKKMTDKD